jgi:hypothetical protein
LLIFCQVIFYNTVFNELAAGAGLSAPLPALRAPALPVTHLQRGGWEVERREASRAEAPGVTASLCSTQQA